MVEAKSTTELTPDSESITASQAGALTSIIKKLDTDSPGKLELELDIYEGELSGALYASVSESDGYQQAAVSATGLTVTAVQTPDESLTALARIEPDPGETVEDAVDSLTFAGD